MKRVIAQSFAVSDDEKLAIEVLAAGEGLKGGTFVRQMFYRGLSQYVRDPGTPPEETEEEVFELALRLIESDKKLSRLKILKAELDESSGAARRVYASRNMPDENGNTESGVTDKKKDAGKRARR